MQHDADHQGHIVCEQMGTGSNSVSRPFTCSKESDAQKVQRMQAATTLLCKLEPILSQVGND